jgi:hypothetical protein
VDDEQATSTAPRPAATIHALRTVRRMGLAGSLLLAVGALGAAAAPLPNPKPDCGPQACDVAESVSTLARRVGADAATPARPIYLALALPPASGTMTTRLWPVGARWPVVAAATPAA